MAQAGSETGDVDANAEASRVPLDREQRFAAFVAEHQDKAVRIALRFLGGDPSAAEDVAQEAFCRAYRGLSRFRGESSLATWFYRILVREAGRHRRWRTVRQRFAAENRDDWPDPKPAALPDPALRERIARALGRISRGQREAFILVHLEGLSIPEAAAVLGRSTGTVKTHLHRALRSLRTQLDDLVLAERGTP